MKLVVEVEDKTSKALTTSRQKCCWVMLKETGRKRGRVLSSAPLAESNRKPASKGKVWFTGSKSQHHKAE